MWCREKGWGWRVFVECIARGASMYNYIVGTAFNISLIGRGCGCLNGSFVYETVESPILKIVRDSYWTLGIINY